MDYEPHPTPKKHEVVKELTELFEQAKGLYLADFTGLNVEEANALRRSFRKQRVVYRVVKNTLIRHACCDAGYQDLIPHLEGPTALAISFDDPVLPVRLVADFVKDKEKETPVFKAGMLEKAYVGPDIIKSIKDIPSREVLLAQILSSVQAPLVNFVVVLNEVLRSFMAVLQAVIDKKQTSEPSQSE